MRSLFEMQPLSGTAADNLYSAFGAVQFLLSTDASSRPLSNCPLVCISDLHRVSVARRLSSGLKLER